MSKSEWGTRHVCFSCGCKFYDLNRKEPLCPRCGSDPREAIQEARTQPRPSRVSQAPEEEEVDQEPLDEAVEVVFNGDAILDEDESEEEEEEEEF